MNKIMKYLRCKIIFQGEHHRICKMIMMLVIAFFAGTNCNAQNFTSGNLNYTVTSTTALTVAVSGPATGYTGSVNIPATVTNPNTNITYHVTSIAGSAFNSKGVTGTLTMPEGLTSIGGFAFRACGGLTGNLVLPSTLTYIGAEAFNMCSGFTGDLLIPDGVSVINGAIFANCTGLNGKLHIPANVTSIATHAFQSCTNLKGPLTIPSGVTSIAEMAFYLCGNLTGDLVIPDGVTTIGSSAFGQCAKLTGIAKIPAAVTSIGDAAFSGCGNVFCSISAGFAGSVGAGAFASTKGVWFNDKTPAFTSATGGLGASTTYYIPEDDVASNAQTDATSIKALYQAKIISTSNVIIRYYHLGLKTVSRPLADITIHNYGHATAGVATLYVNFPALVPSGLKAFYGKEVKSAGAVYITSIDNTLNSSASIPSIIKNVTSTVIPTRCPVVLMGDVIDNDTVFEAVRTGTSVAFGTAIEPTGANAQKGILSGSLTNIDKSTVTGGDVYTFGMGNTSCVVGFYPYNGTTLSAHKAYLLKTPEMLSKNNEYVLSIDNSSNQTDAISGTTLDSSAADNAPYFTLQGVRIAKPTKGGIYIHNGKKTVMY
jgi:hypothetical protein